MTATLPPHADVRDCRLYRFRVYHPDDMGMPAEQRRIVIGYIGETWRWPLARLLEHVYDQPWADTVVGWDLDPHVFAGKAAVLAAEAAAIRAEKPLYNVKANERNPGRIPPPLAMRQRRARDAAKVDAPRWVHPDDRSAPATSVARTVVRVSKPWAPWQKRLLGWSVTWAVFTIAGWITLVVKHQGGWKQTGGTAAVLSAVVVMLLARWVWLGCPVTKKQRRAARRRRKR